VARSIDELEKKSREGSLDDTDKQYMRDRPWTIEELRRRGGGELDKVLDDVQRPPVEPVEHPSRVTTEELQQGAQDSGRVPQPNADQVAAGDGADDDYDTWTKQELVDEVEERNKDGRETPLATSGTKQELVDRLRADDEAVDNT
jgi:hypothetical protein